ncbi:hypothetical protein ACOMHN_059562 [Nucella lapillus]
MIMAMLERITFIEIPEEDRNCLQQVCRISLNAAQQCRLSLGQCVRIHTPNKFAICRVFLSRVSGTVIQYDTTVTVNADISQAEQKVDICRLDCTDGKEICVKLVVDTIQRYRHLQAELAAKCLRCLRGFCLAPGCAVDFAQSKLARLYGFSRCLVLQCFSDAGQTDSNAVVKVTEKTVVKIGGVQSTECYQLLEQTGRKGKAVGGVEQERKLLARLLNKRKHLLSSPAVLLPSPAVLLWGPPGCGKSSLVQQVARDCGAALLTVSGAEVVGLDPEEKVMGLFDKAVRVSREAPCILFLDAVDCLCGKRGGGGTAAYFRMTLLTLLDKAKDVSDMLVVVTASNPSALDPDIRQAGRLGTEIIMPVPTSSQRREIFQIYLRKLLLADDLDLDWLSSATPGYVGADIELVCKEAEEKAFERGLTLADATADLSVAGCVVGRADMWAAIVAFKPAMQRGVDSVVSLGSQGSVQWSDIGGLHHVKRQIQQAVKWPLLYPDTLQTLGLPLTKGVLLYGPPGCGKTMLVKAAATSCHVTLLTLSCAQLYSPYVGDSEKKVYETFQKARDLAPSILFLDELDSMVGSRSRSSGSGVSERVLSALLNEMDGVGIRTDKSDSRWEREVEGAQQGRPTSHRQRVMTQKEINDRHVLVVGATNRPDMLDAALLRPGRMDRLIHIPPPDTEGRRQSLRIHSRDMPLADDVDFDLLADLTAGYTGADIKVLCKETGVLVLMEAMDAECVRHVHFMAALDAWRPSLPPHRVGTFAHRPSSRSGPLRTGKLKAPPVSGTTGAVKLAF